MQPRGQGDRAGLRLGAVQTVVINHPLASDRDPRTVVGREGKEVDVVAGHDDKACQAATAMLGTLARVRGNRGNRLGCGWFERVEIGHGVPVIRAPLPRNRSRAGGAGHSNLPGFPSPKPSPQRCRFE